MFKCLAQSRNSFTYSVLLAVVILVGSCKKTDTVTDSFPIPGDSIEIINRWILDSMSRYYYWGDAINPKTLAGKPEAFFASLLNGSDRFSWISDGQTIASPQTSFHSYGFEYLASSTPSYSSVSLLGTLALVAPHSAADNAGLKRGMYFSRVNNQLLLESNLDMMNDLLNSGKKITLTLVKDSSGTWKEYGTKTISSQYFEDRPVYKTQVFEKGGKKTGFIFYNSFTEFFDADLFSAFASMKDQQIGELIIDLRYNGGGSTVSASKLIALMSSCNPTDIFSIFKGNRVLKTFTQTFEKSIATSSSVAGNNFSQIINHRSGINRVFILSSLATASAAEMTVNNLKPYTTVILIGEKTTGKDMAGAIIKDLRQPKRISWFMQPVIYKIYNSQNIGDYSSGIVPDHIVDEQRTLPLFDLGSKSDPLIKKSLQLIYGDNNVSTTTLVKEPLQKEQPLGKIIYSSVRHHAASAPLLKGIQ